MRATGDRLIPMYKSVAIQIVGKTINFEEFIQFITFCRHSNSAADIGGEHIDTQNHINCKIDDKVQLSKKNFESFIYLFISFSLISPLTSHLSLPHLNLSCTT